jgi:hypothetical protein
MITKAHVVAAAVLAAAVFTATPASADCVLTAFAGVSFKGALPDTKMTSGTSLLVTSDGWAGVEVDFVRTPSFLDDGLVPDTDSRLTTLMGNLALALPISGKHGLGVRLTSSAAWAGCARGWTSSVTTSASTSSP